MGWNYSQNGASSVSIDPTVGPRILQRKKMEFYIPVPMFLVKAIK